MPFEKLLLITKTCPQLTFSNIHPRVRHISSFKWIDVRGGDSNRTYWFRACDKEFPSTCSPSAKFHPNTARARPKRLEVGGRIKPNYLSEHHNKLFTNVALKYEAKVRWVIWVDSASQRQSAPHGAVWIYMEICSMWVCVCFFCCCCGFAFANWELCTKMRPDEPFLWLWTKPGLMSISNRKCFFLLFLVKKKIWHPNLAWK